MIRLENLAVCSGTFALQEITFTVPEGAYGVLMGPTGGGKTTLLETICGLRQPLAGHVWLGPHNVTALEPGQRTLGYVPQDGVLFPTMTVRQQLGFALRVRGDRAAAIAARVAGLAGQLGISALLERSPDGLSGGERQRVALGRALAAHPKVLLLDEPLSALDDQTREGLTQLLKVLQRQSQITILHVTHRLSEATQLADVLFHLDGGRIQPLPCPPRV